MQHLVLFSLNFPFQKTSQFISNTSKTSNHVPCIVLEETSKHTSRTRSSQTVKNTEQKTRCSFQSEFEAAMLGKRKRRNLRPLKPVITPMFDDSDEEDFAVVELDLSNIL